MYFTAYPVTGLLLDSYRSKKARRACFLCRARHKAHARRKFYDIHVKDTTPITTHVLKRIAKLYKIESDTGKVCPITR
ncbi:IS66 family transposase [Paralcaligenes ureilyticus]|uniref:Transposase IS66 family protein n=1 Tax=Paralcaligenes ureilyticus TaxID=627131 RepID=A0A4R3M8A9_9BURK|nr:transposase [Paralcaligenes ureilyticus]TCT09610.1 transposase IS66 family protein [Paralcaligenes ureilyticus]